jgi:hypothetical protein
MSVPLYFSVIFKVTNGLGTTSARELNVHGHGPRVKNVNSNSLDNVLLFVTYIKNIFVIKIFDCRNYLKIVMKKIYI